MEVTRANLRRLIDQVVALADESDEPAVKLSRVVLHDAADAAVAQPDARRIADLDFALTDLRAAVDDLPSIERNQFHQPMEELTALITEMRERTRLPQALLDHIARLRTRLEERRIAVSRQGFTPPGTTPPPLPHPTEQLAADAKDIQRALRKAGFDTPSLDQLVDSPQSVYMSELSNIVDELDVITG